MKPNRHIWSVLTSVLLLLFALTSCNPTRHIQEGEYLVVKNVIHLSSGVEDEVLEVGESDLETLIRQKPNRKIFGFVPFHLAAWNTGESLKKDSKIKQSLTSTIGEEPVTFEQTLFERSTDQLKKFMRNSGYFDARVEALAIKDKKTVEMHFYVYSGQAYRLRRWSFALEDTSLRQLLTEKDLDSKLNRGDRFDAGMFEEERNRLTNWMKNQGYYTFDKIHVIFDVDTNIGGHRYDVAVRLRNLRRNTQVNGRDSIVTERHEKFLINNVYINPMYDARLGSQGIMDSTMLRGYIVLSRGRSPIRPFRLVRTTKITPGAFYSDEKTQYTYARLKALNNFRFIDIKYEPVPGDAPLLDTRINLAMAPRQSVTFEATGTNRSGNLGISGGVNYQNKNLLRGAEQFGIRLFGGLEAQRTVTQDQNESAEVIDNFTPFNTYEIGLELRLDIPDFMFQRTNQKLPWFKEPKTSISATVDRQVRPDYLRDLINASYSVSMKIRDKDLLTFTPVDMSLISLDKNPDFEQRLLNTNNALLINSFNDHLIPASRLSYSFTTQDLDNELKNYYYYRTNLELAGNLVRLGSSFFNPNYVDSTDSYQINGIRFAQYVKLDLDLRQYVVLNRSSRVVYRFYGGIGVPLTNLNTLPFDRSFFGGGSNGIRAWNIRTLGPGSTSDTTVFGIDQVGEMHLELNAEYRVGLSEVVEGALFADIGNIWLLRYDPQRPNAEFDLRRLPRDLAIAPGMGLRLNFNFFVIRFDWGLQLRNPALPEGERWLFQPKTKTNEYRQLASQTRVDQGLNPLPTYRRFQSTVNLAIGYPF